MRLHDVANVFNNLVCNDAYTGEFLVMGQLAPYDDNKRDGLMAERRVMSLSPAEVIPYRRVIAAVGTQYIIGHGSSDDFRGTVIRTGYVAHEATCLSQIRTIEQVCLNQAGFTAYAGRVWVKDLAYTQGGSNLNSENDLHFASTEPIVNDLLATFNGRLNVVRSVNFGAGGTLVATCEQLDEPTVETATVLIGTYDPVADATTGSPISIKVVRMQWQSLFTYRNSAAPKFLPGDIQVAVAKSAATVVAGSTLTLSDGSWRVESVVGEGNVWLCRATRYG